MALVGGLAAGAIISILLAPDSGEATREKIAGGARNLRYGFQDKYKLLKEKVFGVEAIEEDIIQHEIPHFTHKVSKKAKSDIKEIIGQSHESSKAQDEEA